MTLNTNPATFNGPKVTLSPIGGVFVGNLNRLNAVADNTTDLTQAAIYNQFIYSAAAPTLGAGIDILIQRLAPNTPFGLTLWSYDNASSGSSDWNEVASGRPANIQTGYYFNGPTKPAADYDDTLGAVLTSSATGQLDIQGTFNYGTIGVFINALRLIANPVIRITKVQELSNGNLQLTVETQYPGQSITFQESPDLSPGSWQTATDTVSSQFHGPIVTAEFPLTAGRQFYRVVSP
jgi:hypothetical protein